MRQIQVPNPMTGGKGLLPVVLTVLCVVFLAPSLFAHENPKGAPVDRVELDDWPWNDNSGWPWIDPQRGEDPWAEVDSPSPDTDSRCTLDPIGLLLFWTGSPALRWEWPAAEK